MEAVMSALSAIESPVAAADAPTKARAGVAGPERRLRVVDGSPATLMTPAADGSFAATQPRSSSIPGTANRGLPGRGCDSSVAATILTGVVVRDGRQRSAPATHGRAASAPVRLTRRGRIVVAAFLVAVLSVVVFLLTTLTSGRAQATNHGAPRAGYAGMHQVVVRPGQTLWSIAAAADPAADPRNVVQDIMSANALGSPTIKAGQLLWVP